MERMLLLVATALVLTSTGLVAALALTPTTTHSGLADATPSVSERLSSLSTPTPPKTRMCLTPECIASAHLFLEHMDRSADPCDDFYQFACGGYEKKYEIPEDKTSLNMFVMMEEDLKGQLKRLIEAGKQASDPEAFRKMKDVYRACMNTSLVEKIGATPLQELLKRMGGWPVLAGKAWAEEEFDWQKTLFSFRDEGMGVGSLFDLTISRDMKNSSRRLIELDQPSLGMPDRAYLLKGPDDPLVKAYFKLMVDIAVALGASREFAETDLKPALHFEIALANFSLAKEDRRNYTELYHLMRVANLSNLAPQVNWKKFLDDLLPQEIGDDEPVVVNVPAYVKKAFAHIASTPKRVVANYMIWRAAASTITLLGREFRDIRLEYVSQLTGQSQEPARWLRCMSVVSSATPNALGAIYVRKYFKIEAKHAAVEMVDNIREQFRTILSGVEWMDDVTRTRAMKKLSGMQEHIAYPDELLDDKKLNDFYEKLVVNDSQHFENVMRVRKFATDYSFNLLRKPVNKSDWVQHGDAAEVNAFYNPPENSIHFPAGILRGVFFGSHRPNYLNYGGIGFVIGHEMTHGFDDQGRQFDLDGNLNSWWEDITDQRFRQKAQCLIEQYGNYTLPENGLQVNGINTQGENIADNGGIKEAYEAYLRWEAKSGPEELMPALNYTQRQLFWLSAANVWCSKERPESLALRVMTGVHSPSRFRVNGPLSNSPQFAQDFQCPLGSSMNPAKKCHVW